jgi:DNA-binding NtrC family response regulator
MSKQTVLILDDMLPILDIFKKALSNNYDVIITSSLNQAKTLTSVVQFDFVFTDVNLGSDGSIGGFNFINYLIDQNFLGKIIVMSGYMQPIPDKMNDRIDYILHKPFYISDVLSILEGKLSDFNNTIDSSDNSDN